MSQLEFFFDLSSPWTYLAFHNIQPIIARKGAEVRFVPILVGGVFNAVNKSIYAQREDAGGPKMRHMVKSVADWAAWSGIEMRFPSAHHPIRSVHAMRVCCALAEDQSKLVAFATAAFAAYFGAERNIDDPEVLAAIADEVGLDGKALLAATGTEAVKARLRSNTEELISRGGYGSPTIFVDKSDMYFGNDQLPLVEAALGHG